ncbi:MAG TPA: CBS domain-containing protein [Acidobacteriota bacterium]|nr:CBS domain-containing protein [Acidobacteriota bacterium]
MKVARIAQVPPPVVSPFDTVLEAVRKMQKLRVGAAVVVEDDRAIGILSERDVMLRVVAAQMPPDRTPVSAVMTTRLEHVPPDADARHALKLMVENHIRHLPIMGEDKKLVGLLSIRNLLQNCLEDVDREIKSLEAYFTADGPGG